eukprot:TRINITY_DN1441_c0_g1_i3.p1 TRINITY_DN1441_c0_g1~~TRINITY_DN1441_c0_g1_i3.p1  ORF type:complete len:609 (-),score=73.16 TRINITY_DN1441_c0_g1_i3:256-2082(-)
MQEAQKNKAPYLDLNNELYGSLFRARVGYALVATMTTLISFGVGLGLQAYISIYERRLPWHFRLATIFATAAGVILSSLVCDELCLLLYDGTMQPPLARSRSFFAAVLGRERIDIIDRMLTMSFEVISMASFFIAFFTSGSPGEAVESYVLATGCMCILGAFVAIVMKLYAMLKPKISDAQCKLEASLRMMRMGETYEEVFARCDNENQLDTSEKALVELNRESFGRALLYIMLAVLLEALSWLLVMTQHEILGIMLSFSLFIGALLVSAAGVHVLMPRAIGRTFNALIGLFTLFGAMLMLAPFLHLQPRDADDTPLFVLSDNSTYSTQKAPDGSEYPLCRMQFGKHDVSEEKRLTPLDVLAFARAAYAKTEQGVKHHIWNATHGTALEDGVVLEELEDPQTVGRWAIIKIPASKTRVLAVRGTVTTADAMADADLWAGVHLVQSFNKIVPILETIPTKLTKKLVSSTSMRSMLGEPRIWTRLLAAAERAKRKSDEENYAFVVTGHSLGGGLAQIVGASLHAQTLVFSPVGVKYSTDRFGIDEEDVSRYVTVVQPRKDPVPRIDKQPGFVQLISCKHSAFVCHGLVITAGELHATCGDTRGRIMIPQK